MSKSTNKHKKSSKSRRSSYVFHGTNTIHKEAFINAGKKQEDHYNKTGSKYKKEEMAELYKKGLLKEKAKKLLHVSSRYNKSSKQVKNNKKIKAVSSFAYSRFNIRYKRRRLKYVNSFKRVEAIIDSCDLIMKIAKEVFSKIDKATAFIRLTNDGKNLIISFIVVKNSIYELIDVANVRDNSVVPIKEEFKTLVLLMKETKSIYDALQDIIKQISIIVL